MQLTDILAQTGGLQAIARQLGLSESQTATGAAALLPAILGGFQKQAQAQPQGAEGLAGLLNQLGGGGLLDDLLGANSAPADRGNNVLGQIFGSKDVSRAVAHNAQSQTGLDEGILKKMLPLLAMAVAGYMAKQPGTATSSASGGLGGLLGGLLGGQKSGASGLGGLTALLDRNGDGNPLDDILRMAGKTLR